MAGACRGSILPGMDQLSCDRDSWRVGGRRAFLASGELHYFRLPRTAWRDRLRSARDAGLGCVATYTPWLIHEPESGRWDFSGDLDLGHFLDLCQEEGLHALVRPGPYQYSELAYDGLPGWLCADAGLRARRLDGTPFRESSVSYLHPRFLALTRRWFDQVLPIIAARQTTRGGAVAAVQFDNELMGIHHWFGSLDYHPESMGVGQESGRWPAWLQARHGSLAAANACYGSRASGWAELRPVERLASGSAGERRLIRDYQDFYSASIAAYAGILAGWMRAAGIAVPLVHNSAGPGMNAWFRETVAALGGDVVLGCDHYYNLGQDWEQNHPTPKYVGRCAYSLAQMAANGHPPTVFEMPGGSSCDWPPISGQDARCAYLANLAYGMKGWNYYIFAGGWNRPGTGTTGEVYDYGAGVAPDGTRRELFHVQQAFHAFCARHAWLAEARQASDLRLALVWDYTRAARWLGDQGLLPFSAEEAWTATLKGPWITASCAGMAPTYQALDGQGVLPTDQPLLLVAAPSLARAVQRQLVDFLRRGGRLLIAPLLPWLDEDLEPCRILAEALGAPDSRPERFASSALQLEVCGVANVCVSGGLWDAPAPAGAETIAVERRSGRACGWVQELPGGGAVALLGLHWVHQKLEHGRMLEALLARLGQRRLLAGGDHRLWAVLRHDGRRCALFALNLFTFPVRARWTFAHPGEGSPCDTGEVEVPGATVMVWTAEEGWAAGDATAR